MKDRKGSIQRHLGDKTPEPYSKFEPTLDPQTTRRFLLEANFCDTFFEIRPGDFLSVRAYRVGLGSHFCVFFSAML